MANSLLILLDDIAVLLDDVAAMTKLAAKKTAGVIGDDLALNANQISGIKADRELSIIWQVAKGSLLNKVFLVPAAMLISAFFPWLVTPLLMIGGGYLCYEGFEKIWEAWFHAPDLHQMRSKLVEASHQEGINIVEYEQSKIRGAIRTDFILSAEIIILSLGAIQSTDLLTQSITLSIVALSITILVYGLVALIVRIDDMGLGLVKYAQAKKGMWFAACQSMGLALLGFSPLLMKWLTVIGTAAMFVVGGGIFVHGIEALHHTAEYVGSWVDAWQVMAGFFRELLKMLVATGVGVVVGGVVFALLHVIPRKAPKAD